MKGAFDTWICEICKEERPDRNISVISYLPNEDLPNLTRNLKYCNDNADCIEKAHKKAEKKEL